ncbi:helix-turn-helix domain-containing protein [Sulfobacillus thermosulfidooxidans]|uniref:helix-turn-helix domain-containing protein n=1 Tax=Sulfobacillus thermosulfidooxidans TaxID=28034 RepID=UPI0006B64917|nr:tetratricopeptide repeat protein [Sulfobacillus thermosulfidooxidans]
MSLGQRIRQMRLQQGLSQAELAGHQLSRAYISRIESGSSIPSRETLEYLANRLDRPVDFFLSNHDIEQKAEELIRESQMTLQNNQPDKALELAQQAVTTSLLTHSESLIADARYQIGCCYAYQNDVDKAYDALQDALWTYLRLNDRKKETQTLYYLGSVCFNGEEFKQAARFFRTALARAREHKRFLPLYLRTLTALGSTLFRLGQLDEAFSQYQEAQQLAEQMGETARQIDAMMGMSWIQFRQGLTEEAIVLAEKTLELSEHFRHYQSVPLKQNLGIMIFDKAPEKAHQLWIECLEYYREHNDRIGQVTILEELGRYHIFDRDLAKADYLFHQALALAHAIPSIYLAGRLYRDLGDVALLQKLPKQADELFRLAYGCFRTLHAEDELRETEKRFVND